MPQSPGFLIWRVCSDCSVWACSVLCSTSAFAYCQVWNCWVRPFISRLNNQLTMPLPLFNGSFGLNWGIDWLPKNGHRTCLRKNAPSDFAQLSLWCSASRVSLAMGPPTDAQDDPQLRWRTWGRRVARFSKCVRRQEKMGRFGSGRCSSAQSYLGNNWPTVTRRVHDVNLLYPGLPPLDLGLM